MSLLEKNDNHDVVLVVDDSADALSMVNDTLEQVGIDTLVALEGQQALTIAKRMRPDMILLDALMPRMDGFETCRRLKADPDLAAIPVIFMTGLSDTKDIVKGLEAGGVDYLTKPIRPTELIARIRVHLNNARITQNAHNALDNAGQMLLSVDRDGALLWSTPQTAQHLEKLGSEPHWQLNQAAGLIKRWLATAPNPGDKQPLGDDAANYSLMFVEARNRQEYLLRLVESVQLSEQALLQQNLGITPREADVLLWIAHGKTNREVGLILDISPRTVNKHLELLFQKLGVENRTSAASTALKCLSHYQQ
ncbi:MAG: response regulator transcription factor [Cellvibrionaceae bacterium]|nr:response regulator transcription factor [Cellvibrionaceae bacterium]